MEGRGVQRKLTAILSADVVGYSRLMTDDDIATVRVLTEHRGMMKIVIEGYRGRVVDAPGDAVLAEFPSVVDAVECAVVVQKELKAQNDRLPPNRRMQFRIGINLGDVIVDGDKIYGDGVNIAARLEGLADPGGICISGSAYDQIENKLPLGYESLGPQVVKNFAKPVRVYRAVTSGEPVIEAASSQAAPPTRVVRPKEPPAATVHEVPASSRATISSAVPAPPTRRRAALVAGVLVLLGAIGGIAAWRLTSPAPTTAAIPPAAKRPSLAVLPIVNATGDPARDAAAAQLDNEMRSGLVRLSGVITSAASAVEPYRSRSVSLSQAARELDVRYVLDAGLRTVEGRPRVVATLVDTLTGNTVWTARLDHPVTNVAAIQSDLLQRIIAGVPITLTAEEQAARATEIPAAMQPARAKTLDTAVESPASRRPRADGDARPSVQRGASAAKPGVARRDDAPRAEPAPSRAEPAPSRPEPAPSRAEPAPATAPAPAPIPQRVIPPQS